MDIEIVKLIVQVIATLGMGTVIGGIVSRKIAKSENQRDKKADEMVKQQKDREELLGNLAVGLKCLLRSNIFDICDKANKHKKMSLRDRQQLDEAYDCYRSLHGNSYCQEVYERTIKECAVIDGLDNITD